MDTGHTLKILFESIFKIFYNILPQFKKIDYSLAFKGSGTKSNRKQYRKFLYNHFFSFVHLKHT